MSGFCCCRKQVAPIERTPLDLLIRDVKFVDNDAETLNRFVSKVKEWVCYDDRELMATVDVISGYQALSKNFMTSNLPAASDARGYKQAVFVSQVLHNIAGVQIEDGCLDSSCLCEVLYPQLLEWLNSDPSILQVGIIFTLLKFEKIGMQTLIRALEGESLLKWTEAIIRPIEKSKKTQEFIRGYSVFIQFVLSFLEQEQFGSIAGKILDFVVHLGFDFVANKYHDECLKLAKELLNGRFKHWKHTFLDIPDPTLKSYIKRLITCATNSSRFPCSDDLGDISYQLLEKTTAEILKADKAEHFMVDMMELEDSLTHSGGYSNRIRLREEAIQFFFPVDEEMVAFSSIPPPRLKAYINEVMSFASSRKFPKDNDSRIFFCRLIAKITNEILKPGKIGAFAEDMAAFLIFLLKCRGYESYKVLQAAVTTFRNVDADEGWFPLFEAVVPKFQTVIEKSDDNFLKNDGLSKMMELLHHCSCKKPIEASPLWISLIVSLLERQKMRTVESCRRIIKKNIKWNKVHPDDINKIFDALLKVANVSSFQLDLRWFLIEWSVCLKASKLLKNYGERYMNVSVHILQLGEIDAFECAEVAADNIVEFTVLKDNKEAVMEMIKRIHVTIKDNKIPHFRMTRAISTIMEKVFEGIRDPIVLSDDDLKVFTSICTICLERETLNPEDGTKSPYFVLAMNVMKGLIDLLHGVKKMNWATEFIPLLLSKLADGEESLHDDIGGVLYNFGAKDARILTPFMDEIIGMFLEKENTSLLSSIYTVFSNTRNQKISKDNFLALLRCMLKSRDQQSLHLLLLIFNSLAKNQSELFTEESIGEIIKVARSRSNLGIAAIQIVQETSKRRPGKIIKYLDLLLDTNEWKDMFMPMVIDILSALALYDKNIVNKVLDYLIHLVTVTQDKYTLSAALTHVRLIGFNNLQFMNGRRDEIIDARIQIFDADVLNLKQAILDMMDGKTSEDMKRLLRAQQEAFTGLVEKVDDVGETVAGVVNDLGEQKQELDNVKNELVEQSNEIKRTLEPRN